MFAYFIKGCGIMEPVDILKMCFSNIPVSYTHLDVYKRQVDGRISCVWIEKYERPKGRSFYIYKIKKG